MSIFNYGIILTSKGEQLIANSNTSGQDIELKMFGVGDGGEGYNPTYDELKALESLPGEWCKRNLSSATNNAGNAFTLEGFVPHDVGLGKWVQIFGVYTITNELMYVFMYPRFQKPENVGNLMIEIPWRATVGVSDTNNFTLVVDPSIVSASRQYVQDQDKQHVDALHSPHFVSAVEPIKLRQMNIFLNHQSIHLPQAEDGEWFDAQVHYSVNLDLGDCKYAAPEGEKIGTTEAKYDDVRIVSNMVIFQFVRVNGEWCV